MKSNHILSLVNYLEEKIRLLGDYKKVTEKMVDSNLEVITELIAQRQLIILEVDKITNQIFEIVEIQPKDSQLALKEILSFRKNNCGIKFAEIKNKAEILEKTLVEISYKEKDVALKMEALKEELEEEMLKSNKGKQIIDYCNSFATFNMNGNSFNAVT